VVPRYVLNPFQILGLIPNRTYTKRIFPIYINKNVNVRLFKILNLLKFFTDSFEILIQCCIRIRACFYIPILYRCHLWQVKTCFLWNTALYVGRKINTRYTTYFTITFQCFRFLTHLRFLNSQFHDSISVVPIALLHCILIHFDFFSFRFHYFVWHCVGIEVRRLP
jgi:hypothetical protein